MSCDIFISFRPRGGSEIAQLLKVHFKSLGLEVFISEHNLLQVRMLASFFHEQVPW